MWYTLYVSGTSRRKDVFMKKETVFKALGDSIGVKDKKLLKNGLTVKLMNDDWGWYVRIVSKDHTIMYDGGIYPVHSDAKDEFDELCIKFS